MIKGINGFIGWMWSFAGFALFVGGILLFVSVFFKDVALALFAGMPIPDELFDFIVIFSLICFGFFCMAWGSAMQKRQEWGAIAGGLVRLTLSVYLLAMAIMFVRDPSILLWGEGPISFYNRYDWLIWSLYLLEVIWLLGSTWLLLFSQGRRDFYALAYQAYPPPATATCARCGIILNEDHTCRECDRAERQAYLIIGENKRRVRLEFTDTQEGAVKIIGRQKNNREADITISNDDAKRLNRISGRHALIRYHFDHQQFTVEDLGSLNKSYLNDQPLPPRDPRRLEHGHVINLAKEVEIVFESNESST